MESLESIRSKLEGAKDLKSVVSAMKAMASSNIIQYEAAVASLAEYYYTVALGLIAYFKAEKIEAIHEKKKTAKNKENLLCAIVFGSDQGLVGQFNDSMADFVTTSLKALPGTKEIWVVGERVELLLSDMGFKASEHYAVPNNVSAITPLVQQILIKSEASHQNQAIHEFYIFHNEPKPGSGYQPFMQRFLPLDEKWKDDLQQIKWSTKLPPQIAGAPRPTLLELISGYLFVSLFRACAESLASENASRLEAMQRAKKNIDDLLEGLTKKYNRFRQSAIDEELFDVVSGFEALKKDTGI
jgi:F-type H+-transporting ATPase subunit gamma